jgi:serine/threonine-protein kinase RsbW
LFDAMSAANEVMAQEQLKLRVEAGASDQAQRFVAAFAARHGMVDDDSARAQIVVEELITNLIKYGYQGRAGPGTAEVALFLEEGRLTIELVDDGGAFDPFSAPMPEIDRPLEARVPGGMGLRILRLLTEGGHYSRVDNRNLVRLTLLIASPPAA